MVLFLVGIYFFLTIHTGNISTIFKENINVVVELTTAISASEIENVRRTIASNEGILEQSITYIDKEEAKQIMAEEIGEFFFADQENNPFTDIIRFNVGANFQNEIYFEKLKLSLQSLEGVNSVFVQDEFYDALGSNLRKMSLYSLFIALLLGVFAITIIHNTVHMALHSDKEEIMTMKLVGADWTFIKKPYLKQSFKIGLVSALISFLAIILLVVFIHFQLINLDGIVNIFRMILLAIALFLIGIVFSMVSTNLVLNKFLFQKNE